MKINNHSRISDWNKWKEIIISQTNDPSSARLLCVVFLYRPLSRLGCQLPTPVLFEFLNISNTVNTVSTTSFLVGTCRNENVDVFKTRPCIDSIRTAKFEVMVHQLFYSKHQFEDKIHNVWSVLTACTILKLQSSVKIVSLGNFHCFIKGSNFELCWNSSTEWKENSDILCPVLEDVIYAYVMAENESQFCVPPAKFKPISDSEKLISPALFSSEAGVLDKISGIEFDTGFKKVVVELSRAFEVGPLASFGKKGSVEQMGKLRKNVQSGRLSMIFGLQMQSYTVPLTIRIRFGEPFLDS